MGYATGTHSTGRGSMAAWAEGYPSAAYTLGVEEEAMLLDPADNWSLAQRIDDVLPGLSSRLGERVDGETHGSAGELSPHPPTRASARARPCRPSWLAPGCAPRARGPIRARCGAR